MKGKLWKEGFFMFKTIAFALLLASASLTTTVLPCNTAYAKSIPVKVGYYQEPEIRHVFDNIPEYYIATIANAEENGIWIAFVPQKKILQDFRILQLEFKESREDGSLSFKTSTIFHYAALNQPLLLKTLLEATIPSIGYSFTNANGNTETYSLSISGMDGSLIIQKILVE